MYWSYYYYITIILCSYFYPFLSFLFNYLPIYVNCPPLSLFVPLSTPGSLNQNVLLFPIFPFLLISFSVCLFVSDFNHSLFLPSLQPLTPPPTHPLSREKARLATDSELDQDLSDRLGLGSSDTLTNGSHRADVAAAKRLAKRLFNLDGFRKSDVARHLSKK